VRCENGELKGPPLLFAQIWILGYRAADFGEIRGAQSGLAEVPALFGFEFRADRGLAIPTFLGESADPKIPLARRFARFCNSGYRKSGPENKEGGNAAVSSQRRQC
jgi:hypothetical protein